MDVTDGEEWTTQKWGEIEEKKKETDKVSRRKQREDDLNRQTGGSLTPRKLFFPDAGSVVVVVTHLHIEGVLSKRPLAGELEVVAEEEGSGQKAERMTEVKKTKKQQAVTEGARCIFLDTCLSCQVLNDFQTLT